eukprot:CAMPEP_0198308406 /NCGR_PEP_ID=MMETSP1450-20131203/1066_1 /TAXON_ID=753684 ORGANISM="Madagascaria erythrocladiodes, Strain CCMP3234" /NCGR_SAMPLE_ID=MMETSP1450 /ASSEMBLY_ACC=CAM_ASM_001115 /LENGTH=503 /DNA_ID=CAMNT_0044011065 /DNA_START=46 /DNA_END=1557 /DNA_ORIENTATION=+
MGTVAAESNERTALLSGSDVEQGPVHIELFGGLRIEKQRITPASPLPVRFAFCALIGLVCGVVAYVYYAVLEALLEAIWAEIPHALVVGRLPESLHFLYIPAVALPCAVLVGLTIKFLGEPGDLASTVRYVHAKAYVPTEHAMPMTLASQFSILGGGSLGPEAPLVAICASVAGWLARVGAGVREKELVRKYTLCGMACALAAFFGVPLGGSLFALEVNHRFGMEFTEHAIEAVLSGTCCLIVFRGLAGLDIGPIWTFLKAGTEEATQLGASSASLVMMGGAIGVLGGLLAALFAHVHWAILGQLRKVGLLQKPVQLALFGGIGISALGILMPHTMFWGEYEFQTIANGGAAANLPHIWPKGNPLMLDLTSTASAIAIGLGKMLAISFTVSGGYRGGFIFPLFASGAAFGFAFHQLFPSVPLGVSVLCFAAAINVSITRTALASTLILCSLSGEVNASPPVLAASLVALWVTNDMPFIRSQRKREDPDEAWKTVVDQETRNPA